ncbi:crossover junction endodeoxyribonuclease RuvC [candidate division WOR-3 bacterium]|nr:crossover junction endodeoxyribonuclease RuvC [candidate division WOR-3 bacterium]
MPTSTSRTRFSKEYHPPGVKFNRIIGIDPGLSATGFGVLEKGKVLGFGVIRTDTRESVPQRLARLGSELEQVLDRFKPSCCAIETLFFKNGGARSVILSAQSRGVLMFILARKKIPVFELTPATIKLAITGSGRASKAQLNFMVRKVLKIKGAVQEHAADALAVAFCLENRQPR